MLLELFKWREQCCFWHCEIEREASPSGRPKYYTLIVKLSTLPHMSTACAAKLMQSESVSPSLAIGCLFTGHEPVDLSAVHEA